MPDLSFLFTLPPWVWIIAVVVIIIVGVWLAVYFEIVEVTFKLPFPEIKLKRKDPAPSTPASSSPVSPSPDSKYSVNITGNTTIGDSKMKVRRGDVQIKDNKLVGKSDIEVGEEKKKKRK